MWSEFKIIHFMFHVRDIKDDFVVHMWDYYVMLYISNLCLQYHYPFILNFTISVIKLVGWLNEVQ